MHRPSRSVPPHSSVSTARSTRRSVPPPPRLSHHVRKAASFLLVVRLSSALRATPPTEDLSRGEMVVELALEKGYLSPALFDRTVLCRTEVTSMWSRCIPRGHLCTFCSSTPTAALRRPCDGPERARSTALLPFRPGQAACVCTQVQ